MKKKRKIELSAEFRARSEWIRRSLQERIEFHERRREQGRRERGEAQS